MWPLRKLKDLCHIEKGATGIMKAVPGPYPMVGIAEERRTHTSYQFDAAAVIIPLVSSTGHGHASLKRIHYQEGKFALGSILCALIPKDPTQLDPLYLYHYLDVYKEQLFVPLMKGMANVSLSMTSIGEVEVPLPTKAEQDEWVQKFEWVNEQQETLTTELDHQRTLLKQLRQAILQEAVQGKLTAAWRTSHPELISGKNHASVLLERIGTEKEALVKAGKLRKPKPLPPIKPEEVPFELPEGWVWCRFGSYAQFERGKFSARPRNDKRFFGGAYPFIQIGSLDERGSVITSFSQTLNEEGLCMSKMFPAGTITIAIVGGTIGNLGVLGTDMCFTDSIVGVRPSPVTCQEYILLLLRSRQPDIRTAAYQHAGQPNISLPNFTELLIPLPPIPEQLVIVEQVEILVTRLDELERELDASCAVSDSLLQSVLSEVMGGPGAVRYAEAGGELPLAAEPQVRQGRATKASTQVHEGH